ncbi:glucose-methanol-choline oxidoreductase [Massilia cavernae]|uniref:Glucose-methanol-choline oxidoreductase n=2 Tax=Massilia cavernae TaxID=2320864 RepID=A0A418Y0U2_9BURK|nr:glucose-methanol-choline oxidoreductase [Massilia cavernae]
MQAFDYVIVGAGAAGCVLAHRLSEDPSVTVALIEAGGSGRTPLVSMPKGFAKLMQDVKRTWMYKVAPEKGNAFRESEQWQRGRMMGGSSAINGMMYVRGQPADYDEIAAQTSDDWSWKHIGAAFKQLESHELGADPTRGDRGPLRLTLANRRNALTEAMVDAGPTMGLTRKTDVNAPDGDPCIGYATRTIFRGQRQSAARAFIDPIRHRANLTIFTDMLVDKVNFEGRRARSVAVIANETGQASEIQARREVILTAGAMASPGILQRSGIGDRALLQQLGIPLVHESPQVGRRMLEHRCVMIQWRLRVPLSDNTAYSGLRLLGNVARYFLTRTGPMSSGAFEIGAWLKSSPKAARPDIQFLVAPWSYDMSAASAALDKAPGMSIAAYPLRPSSQGEIHIVSRDPRVLPTVKPNYVTTDEDRALMLDTIRLARQYGEQASLRPMIEAETFPGPQCVSDADILDACEKFGMCGYHAVGSCRMGNDAESVIDPELRVRGVDGLRVVDTSIFPQIPSGNTNGPTMAMAWRAADVIRRG